MAQEKKAIDVGHEMGDILIEWRNQQLMDEDVASAIIHALLHYSIELEGGSESGMSSCLFARLKAKIDEQIRSI